VATAKDQASKNPEALRSLADRLGAVAGKLS
jgi:hypothetical protein